MEVTGYFSEEVDEMLGQQVISGAIDGGGNLVLTRRNGESINAGKAVDPLRSWPVNSIYIGASSTNPADILGGGVWARFGEGRVLVSQSSDADFDTALETGGSKTQTLTVNQLPSHDHSGASGSAGSHTHLIHQASAFAQHGHASSISKQSGNTGSIDLVAGPPGADNGGHNHGMDPSGAHTHTIPAQGGGQPVSVVQPYIVVYMWRRTG